MIKEKIHQEDKIQQYAFTQHEASKYIKQLLTKVKWETDKNILIPVDINSLLTAMDKLSKQKSNTEIPVLNYTIDKMNELLFTKPFIQNTRLYILL